ncbi:DUF7322 domain-containing protein [Halegenticoccus soli]|uniref:DUF7322 domain-containing protein n=1 Tax=Halegenticoccus soli TaxID=1985678 RepID=UPI0018ED47AB|nr:hypothetical protein [Halegenticoccus soli]
MTADPWSDEPGDGDDPWPDEPDEPDPEARWSDPERELPTVPSVPDPRVSEPKPRPEAVREIAGPFWASVVFVNLGLFALCLGLMLVYFRDQWTIGGGLVVGGTLALVRTYQIYREFRRSRDGADGTDADGDDPDGNEGVSDAARRADDAPASDDRSAADERNS